MAELQNPPSPRPLSEVGPQAPSELNDRAWEIRRKSPAEALGLAREARRLAVNTNDEQELARALRTLGNLTAFTNDNAEAECYLREALRLSETHGDEITAAWTLYGLTKVAYRSGDLKAALTTAQLTFEKASKFELTLVMANALNAMGAIYKDLGLLQEALKSFRASLDLFQATDESGESVIPLYNINLIYAELGQYKQALSYADPAFEAFERNGDAVNAAGALMNIGDLYSKLEQYDLAMSFLSRALQRFMKLNDDHATAQAHFYLGRTYHSIHEDERAWSSFASALDLYRDDEESSVTTVRVLIGMAHMQVAKQDFEAALDFLIRALPIAGAKGLKKQLYQIHEGLSKAYKESGQLEEALEHFEQYHALKEEIADERLRSVMDGMQVQFDVEREQHKLEVDRLTNRELARMNQKLRVVSERLEQQNMRDELTGASNRRHLNTRLAEEHRNARAEDLAMSVILCDIDHFKKVNDTFSHAVGDSVLQVVASLLEEGTRDEDLVARYGGEEFAIAMPRLSLTHALTACERLRLTIEEYPWSSIHENLRVTMSFGVSDRVEVDHYEKLLGAADEMLYRAKREGRNRVCG
jgi:diguanylate cyclase (GGDEF)-like protein